MRILVTCLSKSWGGMEMYTVTSLKQLLKNNVYAELLCLEGSRLHIEANNLGLIIHAVKSSRQFNVSSISKIITILKRGRFDIIHSHYSKDLWQVIPALELMKSKIPIVLTKHLGSFIIKKDLLHKWIYNRLNAAVAISNVIKNNLLETCPLTPGKVFVINNGIDTDRFSPDQHKRKKIRNEFGIKDEEIVIGMIARFSPGKGHEEFISAASALNKRYSHLKYLIVGEASRGETDYEEQIKKMAMTNELDNLIFTGYRGDTEFVLNAMDIFAFPSHAEAFGIALVEAMSTGLPSVCSNSDGVLDIAIDRSTSYLFQVKDFKDLENKLIYLIDSPEKRNEFGNSARKRVHDYFNIDVITKKTLIFYENIIRNCG